MRAMVRIVNGDAETRRRHPSSRPRLDHHMVSWPLRVARTRFGSRVERLCPHQQGHPDPSWLASAEAAAGLHACDGCCRPPSDLPST